MCAFMWGERTGCKIGLSVVMKISSVTFMLLDIASFNAAHYAAFFILNCGGFSLVLQ